MDLTKKIKIALIEMKMTQQELCDLTLQSKSNLSQKLKTNNFKISEFQKLVNALGCKLEVNIILPNGEKI